jgi:hypothetical protein
MKMKWIGLGLTLLTVACSHRALRAGCDGPLRPINAPTPLASAAPAAMPASAPQTPNTEKQP